MTITEWIAERRKIAEAATEGPWRCGSSYHPHTEREVRVGGYLLVPAGLIDSGEGLNADFIADARTSLPAALDALEVAHSALIAMHNIESYDRLACDGALRRIEAIPSPSEKGMETK